MVKKFSREISGSQSQYKATIERKYTTQQCSYNLPIELEEHLKSLGAIEKVNPSSKDTNATYKLTNGYKMRLGPNIIAAIGESYKNMTNEVVFTHTEGESGASKKLQLKKTDFKAQGSDNYKWFVDLYEKNIEGTVLTTTVDDEKKTVGFNLELTPFFFSGQSMPELEAVCAYKLLSLPSELSFNQLVEELKALYAKHSDNGVRYFGIKYAEQIKNNPDCNATKLAKAAGIESYQAEINKGKRLAEFVTINELLSPLDSCDIVAELGEATKEEASHTVVGENVILYGVPGSGKSHTIKRDYCSNEDYMERVVFHPDYSYSDFIGQILPKKDRDGKITYEFKPGPFTRILKNAVNDEDKRSYYLIIEEINRGNAPAIFGDVFQLLDRKNGESEYGITNAEIAEEVYCDPNKKVKIPSNLFVLATMNTSDQNVFTLDTAFKRRWHMKMIENKLEECNFANTFICGTPITWCSFAKAINKKIVEANKNNLSSEDNRLGAYFVDENDLFDIDLFSEKVLMYLWNDAFKFDRSDIFKPQYETLEELIRGFKTQQFEVFAEGVVFESTSLPEAINSNVDLYLAKKNPELVELYKRFSQGLLEKLPDVVFATTAKLIYIVAKKDGKNIAEIQIQKNNIKINTKMPEQEDLQIGRKLPESHQWTNDYEIFLDEANLDTTIAAIMEAHKLV